MPSSPQHHLHFHQGVCEWDKITAQVDEAGESIPVGVQPLFLCRGPGDEVDLHGSPHRLLRHR